MYGPVFASDVNYPPYVYSYLRVLYVRTYAVPMHSICITYFQASIFFLVEYKSLPELGYIYDASLRFFSWQKL